MVSALKIELDIPNVRVVEWKEKESGEYRIVVESTMEGTECKRCGKKIKEFHGHDREIEIRHLPILWKPVYIEMRPKRYKAKPAKITICG